MVFGSGLRVFRFSVNLSDNNIKLVSEVGSNILPDWRKGLAVCEVLE